MTTFAEVAEGVRATIARYTHALDDGRTDDVVATYCADGVFELPGTRHLRGPRRPARDVRRRGSRGCPSATSSQHPRRPSGATTRPPRPATSSSSSRARTAAGRSQFVARYLDVLHHDDGTWRFHRRTGRPEEVPTDAART